MITAAVAVVSIIPALDDAEELIPEYYEVSDGGVITQYDNLADVLSYVNGKESGSDLIIITYNDISNFPIFTVAADKTIVLTSSSDGPFTITVKPNMRHFNVYGSLTLENIILNGNKASGNVNDGGVLLMSSGILIMNKGAVIQNCYSYVTDGGGVSVISNGTFTMNDGAIIRDCSSGFYGGGVSVNDNGTFTMNDGAMIQRCSAPTYGGGVYITKGTFYMNGGSIIDGGSPTVLGGGVNVSQGGTFVFTDGVISNNKAIKGGGVSNGGTFYMNGGVISDNYGSTSGGGVLNSSKFYMNGGVISDNTSSITGGSGGGVYNNYGGIFSMSGDAVVSNNTARDGGGVSNTGTFELTGGEISNNFGGNGGGVYSFKDTTTSTAPSFTMKGGVISGNTGNGVYNIVGTFTMEDGKISNNTTGANGGGVYNSGTFTMEGGEISYNTANLGGGITNNINSTLKITGGMIICNTAKYYADNSNGSGGGIYTSRYTDLIVGDGVVFSGNIAPILRTGNIADDSVYIQNIGAVVLDAWAAGPVNKNAPAYNNFDINCPGDSYIVLASINPGGGGTVTLTDNSGNNGDQEISSDGWFYVPVAAAVSITLSATPADGFEFLQFVDSSTKNIIGGQTDIPVMGNMTVVAEFKQNKFVITAGSDSGSSIDPSGDVIVPNGEDKTFMFSAKSGHMITAVYVDGIAISAADLASGEYTFTNVTGDHTIEIVSKAEVGSGGGSSGSGTGAGGGTGTGGGNGNGSVGNGGDGTGTGSSGNGNGDGSIGSAPGSNGSEEAGEGGNGNGAAGSEVIKNGEWSVLSMICAAIAVFTGMIALIAGRSRFRTDDEERRSKTGITLRVLALIIGIVSVIVFFVTEYGNPIPVAIDAWTPLMFVLLLATLILAMVSFRFDRADS